MLWLLILQAWTSVETISLQPIDIEREAVSSWNSIERYVLVRVNCKIVQCKADDECTSCRIEYLLHTMIINKEMYETH